MIAATLLALAALGTPSAISLPAPGEYADTMRDVRGQASLPTAPSVSKTVSSAPAVCHPDPSKGRACRHHVSKQAEAKRADRASAVLATADGPRTQR